MTEELLGRYFIVNKHGIISECSYEHMKWRLSQTGYRAPTPDELKEFLMRTEAGIKRRKAGDTSHPFMQTAENPIAEPFKVDPDEAMEKIQMAINAAEKYMPKVVNATDGAIQFAEEMGVNLDEVAGSGHNGKIVKGDVMAHLDAQFEDDDAPLTDEEPVELSEGEGSGVVVENEGEDE